MPAYKEVHLKFHCVPSECRPYLERCVELIGKALEEKRYQSAYNLLMALVKDSAVYGEHQAHNVEQLKPFIEMCLKEIIISKL